MKLLFATVVVALVALPLLSPAQASPTGLVGLEIPAPAPPRQGHFLSGAYVVGNYTPLSTGVGSSYAVQPYLRFVLGNGQRPRPYLQYSFLAFGVQQAYGSAIPLYGPGGVELPANPGFAPLGAHNAGYNSAGYGGLGAFSVGIPMRIGNSSAVLSVGGAVLGGLLKSMIDPRVSDISLLGPYWKGR